MRNRIFPLVAALCLGAAASAKDVTIRGDYLEARTSDVYTGPCFANSEVNLTGKQAILAWHVREGAWQGVALEGLSVVAVLRASATLGDPHASPHPVRSVLLVDERAGVRESEALVSLAKSLAGELLGEGVRIERVRIDAEFAEEPGVASVVAGDLAEVRTRALCRHDVHCGNEEVYYPPLTGVQDATAAYALANAYRGDGLGTTWSSPGKRSAFVASFAR